MAEKLDKRPVPIEGKQNLTWLEAYREMTKGFRVARPGWHGGWWFIDAYDGKIKIQCCNGKVLTASDDLTLTLSQTCGEDWYASMPIKK